MSRSAPVKAGSTPARLPRFGDDGSAVQLRVNGAAAHVAAISGSKGTDGPSVSAAAESAAGAPSNDVAAGAWSGNAHASAQRACVAFPHARGLAHPAATSSSSAAASGAAVSASPELRGSDDERPAAMNTGAAASHSGAEAFGTRKGPTSGMRRTPASAPSHSPVGASAPSEGGRGEGNPAPIGDISTAYDEPRSNFHAACPFDCPWHAENVPRGDFFRAEVRQ